ncbi:pyrroloquinoline quinone-dependent dehydrogenase [Dyadobacter psychrotolerans]|uniref:Pyrroloquinoline quinone-dependent dehydrogenase n=1 Tax=Dyadobacter psychrotolerans TaxID=2541721 RepID=A0A4R5DMA7_9BACT|nr:pyrroloquinoline quinone-dependent dehydrogenase [Dyadobacter psychrotolerans]TDE15402.1 pyrroloquinoline quinone-dependent dehydrogenase [Dyadobacter psychrotolerans]
MIRTLIFIAVASLFFLVAAKKISPNDQEPAYTEWDEYLGGPDRNHYSSLTQINPENVKNLKVAWSYSTPDSGQMQVNPIIVNGVLYGVTSTVQAFALDAATGKEIWMFGDKSKVGSNTSRGLTYWSDGKEKRIMHAMGAYLYALDAATGKPIETFGDKGRIDLHTGLPEIAKDKYMVSNTPGTIFQDLIIMPLRLSEDAQAAPGDLRAFNVRTGKLEWTFHTIPYPGEFGYETFPPDAYKNTYTGGANNWAGMAIDRKRGIIYIPTGSAGYDFYGGKRKGKNLFANCLLALDAKTGKRLWHFQTTHHDIWDRDLPAPPNLITVTQKGPDGRPRKIDAVAQVSKQGYVFVFDRVTGKPLFPIKEVAAPQNALPGEFPWPTQPVPSKPASFARQAHTLTDKDISPYAPDHDSLVAKFRGYNRALFAAPSKKGTVILPGFDGGAEWGGAAADPQEGILYVNSNEMAWILSMKDTPKESEMSALSPGEKVYTTYCPTCHGPQRKGNAKSGYPSLVDIGQRRDKAFVSNLITSGKGMMPGFTMLTAAEKQSLISFLFGDEKTEAASIIPSSKKTVLPYQSTGYNKFLDSNGLPAISPPWGTLNAIDLNTGEYLWKIPFGEVASLKAKGLPDTGIENYGGPVVTASGLLFIAATKDGKFRVFDKKNGKLLWETMLPAAGFATPSTYQVNGKQYVVIACGGTKLGTKKGNQFVAFALP